MDSSDKLVVLKNFPFTLDVDKVLQQMQTRGNPRRMQECAREMIELVQPVARPKALYKVCCVDNKERDSLDIDGVRFASRLVRRNLDPVETVFVCVATVGTEVEDLDPPADVMKRFCLDAVKNRLMFEATAHLRKHLEQHFSLKQLSNLNPGETESFPIEYQKNLFKILGDVEGLIGVKLTDNCALVPTKSHSGIYYSTETEFISCRLCTNRRCSGRRAAYEPELAEQFK